ncbi:MAG: T9SS type A sorting domain-containing protein [Candidatus Kapaibacterium sp.]
MKRFLSYAAGIAILFCIAFSVQPAKAQLYDEFMGIEVVTGAPYQELTNDVPVPSTFFGLPPNYAEHPDDGYYRLQFPADFEVEFNGEVYDYVWICVNGFITFGDPPLVPARDPNGMFINASSYPKNVIAPFWGDHFYRNDDDQFEGYMPSTISYKFENDVLTIQWKNLNINDKTVKSSVGNFQVKIYKSQDPLSAQADIEFCYGAVGGNPYTTGTLVVTRGASIGIKGDSESNYEPGASDYYNGLEFGQDDQTIFTSEALSNQWPPSGATDRRIRFNALKRFNIEEWWGDGDVDFSKAEGRKHYGMPQSRFVTVNDARIIMKSIATDIPLDPVRRREAYHADVNHNGRYYLNTEGEKVSIPWRDMYFADNLPDQVSSLNQIKFQANEYDAALILSYLSARVPQLPWVYDYIPQGGKINAEGKVANGFYFGEIAEVNDGMYQIPVYLNGYLDGALGLKFEVNGRIENVVKNSTYETLMADHFNGRVVVAGNDDFSADEPICIITATLADNVFEARNIRFNDEETEDISFSLGVEEQNAGVSVISNYPNPFAGFTTFTVNVPVQGNYSIEVFDMLGNPVATIADTEMSGTETFEWNGTDNNGKALESGMYIYRISGVNTSVSGKLVISR